MSGDDLRPWQRPLSEEKIKWLQEQFARERAFLERIWGPMRCSSWEVPDE